MVELKGIAWIHSRNENLKKGSGSKTRTMKHVRVILAPEASEA